MTDDFVLTASERELIRREFMTRGDETPSVTKGFFIKRWATGLNKGKPKISQNVQSMLDRGLVTVVDEGHRPRVLFTYKGIMALKKMASDSRAISPEYHQALIDELKRLPN